MAWYDTLTFAQAEQSAAPGSPVESNGGSATVGEGQTGTSATTGTEDQPLPQTRPADPTFMFVVVGVIIMMYFMVMLPQRREKKRRAELMSNLKKGDRVLTIGGVMGIVMDVRDKEVVVKVDESNNTRPLRFTRAAIQGVIDPETKEVQSAS